MRARANHRPNVRRADDHRLARVSLSIFGVAVVGGLAVHSSAKLRSTRMVAVAAATPSRDPCQSAPSAPTLDAMLTLLPTAFEQLDVVELNLGIAKELPSLSDLAV